MQPPDTVPADPVDALIARLIRDDRAVATPADVAAIVARIASAPFSRRVVRVPRLDRGLTYRHISLGTTADSLDYHLAKRVRAERQWEDGTLENDYLSDLRAAVRHRQARLLIYERTGDLCAATISPAIAVVPVHRLGQEWQPYLLVVYSALHGTVRTGYMFSSLVTLDLPESARWLR